MSVLNKKSRMISFRLSAVEFTSAQADCERRGVRSVAGLARRALLGVVAQQHPVSDPDLFPDVPIDIKIERLSLELSDLRAQLDRLREAVLPSRDLSPQSVSPDSPGSPNITSPTFAASIG